MPCLKRAGWIKVTMISRGVEIAITGGVVEMKDVERWLTNALLYSIS